MLNTKQQDWSLNRVSLPEIGREVVALIEHDVVENPDVDFPFTRKALFTGNAWYLMDHDPDTEEALLQQYFTVVAWRYFGI